jgi:DeoR/GlpR family transcriptional regulator of sugar metabolism
MFAAERRRKIKEIILEYKHVDVNTLCSLLSVSIATVRRDLEMLESEGFLNKEHGGAILVENESSEILLNTGSDTYTEEKNMIGQIAANLISPGEAIFIGAGSTCACFAHHLAQGSNIIVVTNNLHAAMETAGKPGISTVILGGDVELMDGRIATSGMYAYSNMENMYIDKAFISAQGASEQAGYTVSSREQAVLCKMIMTRAAETIILMDYPKFGKRAFVPLAPLDRFKRVISNIRIEQKYKEYFYDHNVKLFTSFE